MLSLSFVREGEVCTTRVYCLVACFTASLPLDTNPSQSLKTGGEEAETATYLSVCALRIINTSAFLPLRGGDGGCCGP